MNKKSVLIAISLSMLVLIPGFQNCGSDAPPEYSYEDLLSSVSFPSVESDPIEDVSGLCGTDSLVVNMLNNEPVCTKVYKFSDYFCPVGFVVVRQVNSTDVDCLNWNDYVNKNICPLGLVLTGVTQSKKAVCEPLYDDWNVGDHHFSQGRFINTVRVQPKYNILDHFVSEFKCPKGEFLQSGKNGYSCQRPRYLVDSDAKIGCAVDEVLVGVKNWNVPICQSRIFLNANTNDVCAPGTFLSGVNGSNPVCTKLFFWEDFSQACPSGKALRYTLDSKLKCEPLNPNEASPQSCQAGSHLIGILNNQPICASNGPNGFSQYCEKGEYISGVSMRRIVCAAFDFH